MVHGNYCGAQSHNLHANSTPQGNLVTADMTVGTRAEVEKEVGLLLS